MPLILLSPFRRVVYPPEFIETTLRTSNPGVCIDVPLFHLAYYPTASYSKSIQVVNQRPLVDFPTFTNVARAGNIASIPVLNNKTLEMNYSGARPTAVLHAGCLPIASIPVISDNLVPSYSSTKVTSHLVVRDSRNIRTFATPVQPLIVVNATNLISLPTFEKYSSQVFSATLPVLNGKSLTAVPYSNSLVN